MARRLFPLFPTRRRVAAARRLQVEALEGRALPSTMPVLHSNPGAPHTLFLDFDGHFQARFVNSTGVVQIPETVIRSFSVDPDTRSLSTADAAAIVEIWRRVAEDFAPFNVDVTTVEPASLAPGVPDSVANGRALRVALGDREPFGSDPVLTGGGPAPSGNVADPLLNSYLNSIPNIRFVFPSRFQDTFSLASAVSQGAGHAYGLRNQSPPADLRLAILGNLSSTPEVRTTWHTGTNELGAVQDDVALLTRVLGLRADEPGRDAATATPLRQLDGVVPPGGSGQRLVGAGVIGGVQDADYFTFRAVAAGTVTVRLNFGQGVDPTQARPLDGPGADLSARVQVWSADGQRMLSEFVATPPVSAATPQGREFALRVTNFPTILGDPALQTGGRYLLVVRSYGAAGDLGNYTVTLDGPVGFGPRVVSAVPSAFPTDGTAPLARFGDRYEVRSLVVTFDQPIDPATFTAADVTFTGPGGAIAVGNPVAVNPADPRAFVIAVPLQTRVGAYTLTIGPHIATRGGVWRAGLEMDQDQNGIGGDAVADRFTVAFTLGDNTLGVRRL
jgi:hypothetical protein